MPRVPSKVIRETALRMTGKFHYKQLAELCGCHPDTARSHLEKMVSTSKMNRLGLGVYAARISGKSGVIAGKIEIGKGLAGWGGWK